MNIIFFSKLFNFIVLVSVVYSYDSGYAKSLGIASEERPAIVAESNGFNYFMEDFGNHYELSVEKHNK